MHAQNRSWFRSRIKGTSRVFVRRHLIKAPPAATKYLSAPRVRLVAGEHKLARSATAVSSSGSFTISKLRTSSLIGV